MVCPRVVCLFKKKHRCYFIIVEKNVLQIQGAWKGKISSDLLLYDKHAYLLMMSIFHLHQNIYQTLYSVSLQDYDIYFFCLFSVLFGLIHLTMYVSVLFYFFPFLINPLLIWHYKAYINFVILPIFASAFYSNWQII